MFLIYLDSPNFRVNILNWIQKQTNQGSLFVKHDDLQLYCFMQQRSRNDFLYILDGKMVILNENITPNILTKKHEYILYITNFTGQILNMFIPAKTNVFFKGSCKNFLINKKQCTKQMMLEKSKMYKIRVTKSDKNNGIILIGDINNLKHVLKTFFGGMYVLQKYLNI